MKRFAVVLALLPLAACGKDEPAATAPRAPPPAVTPPAPGTPGGLPDERTPVSEAPSVSTSAQGAAQMAQTYFALLEAGRMAEAAKLRSDGQPPDLTAYSEYHAQVGVAGRIEGAAGSLYVQVPVVIYGRLKTGHEVHERAKVVLRRVNDVPGSTAEQRRWRVDRIEGVGR